MATRKSARKFQMMQRAVRSTVESLEQRQLLAAGYLDPTWWDMLSPSQGTVSQLEYFFEYGTLHDTTDSHYYQWTTFGGVDPVSASSGFISNHDVFLDAGGKVVTVGATLGRHLFETDPAEFVIDDPDGTGTAEVTVAEIFDTDLSLTRYDYDGNRDYFLATPSQPNPAGDRDVQDNMGNYPAARWGNLYDVARAGQVDLSGDETTNPNYGSIVLTGTTHYSFASTGNMVLVRYFPVSNLIREIMVIDTPVSAPWSVNDMVIQDDGKILVAGSIGGGLTGNDFTLWRFNSDFTPDTTFGINGVVRRNYVSYSDDEVMGIAIQPPQIYNSLGVLVNNPDAGKILAVGYSDNAPWKANGKSRMVVARFNTDGSADTNWGISGTLEIADFGGQDAVGTAIAIQSDGKAVVVGAYDSSLGIAIDPLNDSPRDNYTRTGNLDSTVVVRLKTDGTIDQDEFGARGRLQVTNGDPFVGQSIALESTGKIVIGGVTRDDAGTLTPLDDLTYTTISRVTVDGFMDTAYGVNGTQLLTEMGDATRTDFFYKTALAIQEDDKAVITSNQTTTIEFQGGYYSLLSDYPTDPLAEPYSEGAMDFIADGVIARVQSDNKPPVAQLLTHDLTITEAGTDIYNFLVNYTDDGYVDMATILAFADDIVITGPNGFSVTAELVGAPVGFGPSDGFGNYTRVTASYRITLTGGAFDGWWDDGSNNGAYNITINAGAVSDIPLNGGTALSVLERNLGQFAVDIHALDVTPPTATLIELPVDIDDSTYAGNDGVTLGGGSSLDFIIEYSDALNDVNLARIGTGDILVTGPSGFSQIATFINVVGVSANAPTIRARYRITAPGGTWDTTDNGAYTINIRSNQVSDTNGPPNYVSAGPLVNFAVAVVAGTDVRPTGYLSDSAGAPLTNPTFIDPLATQNFFIHYVPSIYSNTDAIDPDSFIDNDNAIRVVSALPVFDQLAKYVGYTPDGSGGYVVEYSIAKAAGDWSGADNGTYTIRLEPNQISDLDSPPNYAAVADLGNFTVNIGDQADPTVALVGSIFPPLPGATNFTVTVLYTDDRAMDVASIDGADLSITRVGGGSAITLAPLGVPVITPTGNGTPRQVVYTFAAPGGDWNYLDSGDYTVTLRANQVRDTASKYVASTELGSFTFTDLPPVAAVTVNPVVAGPADLVVTLTLTDEIAVDMSTVDINDITVYRSDGGTPMVLSLVPPPGVAFNVPNITDGTPRTATWTFAAPGGYWEWKDNGTYTVELRGGGMGISDVGGAETAAGAIFTFQVGIAQDLSLPTAAVVNPIPLATPGASSYVFQVSYTDNVAVDFLTIGTSGGPDIQVVDPNGNVYDAELVANSITPAQTFAANLTAYYRIVKGSEFDASDNGTWDVRMMANTVRDVSGNAVAAVSIGSFQVQISDDEAPTAYIDNLQPPVEGAATYSITVVYEDGAGVDLTSINAADIVISRTGGGTPLTLVSAGAPVPQPQDPDNHQVFVIYTFNAPGGTWDYLDVGTYTITLIAGEVRDTSGNSVAGQDLDSFDFDVVNLPPVATATVTPIVSGPGFVTVTLTLTDDIGINMGTVDIDDITVSRIAGGTNISLELVDPPNVAFNIPNATNGTPRTATWTFKAPDGFWESNDNGLWQVDLVGSITDILGEEVPTGGVATFQVNFAIDTTLPTAVVAAALPVTSYGMSTYVFQVQYADNVAIDYNTIGQGYDFQIVDPNGNIYYADFNSMIPIGTYASPIDAYYSFDKGSDFTYLDNGTWDIRMVADRVKDVSGNAVAAGSIGSFTVNLQQVLPPTITSVVISPIVDLAGSTLMTVTYNSTTVPLDMSTIIDNDGVIRVTGPNGFNEFASYVSAPDTSDGFTRTVVYRLSAPGGQWDFRDNGTYTVSVAANNGVENVADVPLAAGVLRTFVVNLQASRIVGETLNISGTDGSDMVEVLALNIQDSDPNNDQIKVIVNNVVSIYDRELISGIFIDVGRGNDTVKINPGVPFAAEIYGRQGNDTIFGGDRNDTINGGVDHDYIVGGAGDDYIKGADGNDRLIGVSGKDTILGGLGNDRITGGGGNDNLLGEAGSDTIDGGLGNDIINGGDGDDFLYGRDSLVDVFYGGNGYDRAQVDAIDQLNDVEELLA